MAPKTPSRLSPQQWTVIFTHFWCSYLVTKHHPQNWIVSLAREGNNCSAAQLLKACYFFKSCKADAATEDILQMSSCLIEDSKS